MLINYDAKVLFSIEPPNEQVVRLVKAFEGIDWSDG